MEKRFLCIQTGARRNYALPSILEKEGLLEGFYNDFNASCGLGKAVNQLCPFFLKKGTISRLSKRELAHDIALKTQTFEWPAVKYFIRHQLAEGNTIRSHQALHQFDKDFSRAMIQQGVGKATHVYSMFGEGSDFIEYAKKHGLHITIDVYTSPLTHKIVQEEQSRYPEIEPSSPQEVIDKGYERLKKVCNSADLFLSPSSFVSHGLESFGVSPNQCQIVPCAVSSQWLAINNRPVKNRVLFVGTAGLRKGIHILGMAAEKLAPYGYEFRVAGHASEAARSHPLTKHLTFLGRIPRSDIHEEFSLADIFVLPTLAEGSAGVTYEALATGLPVITTKASGSVVRHGIDGLIVPEGDSDALADAIKEILENRTLRDQMATAAKQQAQAYTWDKYAERLLNVFQSI